MCSRGLWLELVRENTSARFSSQRVDTINNIHNNGYFYSLQREKGREKSWMTAA